MVARGKPYRRFNYRLKIGVTLRIKNFGHDYVLSRAKLSCYYNCTSRGVPQHTFSTKSVAGTALRKRLARCAWCRHVYADGYDFRLIR